ncbi:MAG: MFS transporter [Rikenellaceae bacterium]
MSVSLRVDHEWDGVPMPQRLFAIMAVAFAVSLGVIDGVIANIALPTISANLDISPSDSIWIVNAYQISVVVTLLMFSTLGDHLGYKPLFLSGITLFMITSFGCAMSWNLGSLIFFRAIQGVGASAVMSVNTSIVRLIYPRRMLGRGLGINSTVVSVSAVMGPSLASAILSLGDWRWIFFVNIPFGIIAIFLGWRYIPRNPQLLAGSLFKWSDGVMNLLSFGLLFAVVTSISHGVDMKIVALLAVVFVVVGYLFVRLQLRRSSPIIPFDLLKIPIFTLSMLTSILSFVAQMSTMVALPFFLQGQLGYSVVETGLLMSSWAATNIITAPLSGVLCEHFHAGVLGGVGLIILTIGLLLLGSVGDGVATWDIVWRLAICGVGFGLFQPPNNSVLIGSAPISRSGSASGMMASARLMGQIIGTSLVALCFYILSSSEANYIIYVSAIFSAVAMVISFSRLSLPLPEVLREKRGKI